MTTIKEYKAMIEGATDAPWEFGKITGHGGISINGKDGQIANVYLNIISSEWVWGQETIDRLENASSKSNAQFIAASRNIAPELIRVMELMGEALQYCADWYQGGDAVTEALSEYRKLRGE